MRIQNQIWQLSTTSNYTIKLIFNHFYEGQLPPEICMLNLHTLAGSSIIAYFKSEGLGVALHFWVHTGFVWGARRGDCCSFWVTVLLRMYGDLLSTCCLKPGIYTGLRCKIECMAPSGDSFAGYILCSCGMLSTAYLGCRFSLFALLFVLES